MSRFFFFGFVLVGLLSTGCGTDEEILEPGEEVVVAEWIDPIDIGGEYYVDIESIRRGGTYLLDTGKSFTIEDGDGVDVSDDGSIIALKEILSMNDLGEIVTVGGQPVTELKNVGTIVPEGPPIVSLVLGGKVGPGWIEGENRQNVVEFEFFIEIDRVLDYNFPVYLEYQTQDRREFGGEVTRTRFLTAVFKGDTLDAGVYVRDSEGFYKNYYYYLPVGSEKRHERASISILPYSEMEKIELPAHLNLPPPEVLDNWGDEPIPTEDRIIPIGHTFRPYRIASSSYLMGTNTTVERNW